jgi:hypothetical protein
VVYTDGKMDPPTLWVGPESPISPNLQAKKRHKVVITPGYR